MYMYWYVQVVGLTNGNVLVNFNFSLHIKIFFYFMLINLAYLNKYIYIIFCHFIYYFTVSI